MGPDMGPIDTTLVILQQMRLGQVVRVGFGLCRVTDKCGVRAPARDVAITEHLDRTLLPAFTTLITRGRKRHPRPSPKRLTITATPV